MLRDTDSGAVVPPPAAGGGGQTADIPTITANVTEEAAALEASSLAPDWLPLVNVVHMHVPSLRSRSEAASSHLTRTDRRGAHSRTNRTVSQKVTKASG